MKPLNWDNMDDNAKLVYARQLFQSMRGYYLASQAFHEAIKALKKIPKKYREESNIQDMEVLRECLFNLPLIDIDIGKLNEKKADSK
jgi:hypothetical protein